MRSIALLAVMLILGMSASADILWYGGDWDGRNGIRSSHAVEARAYDDFELTATNATITGLFGNFLSLGGPHLFTEAAYEIRAGVSEGNGGKLLASGISPANVIKIGNLGASVIYNASIDNLNVPLAAGRYWMSLSPASEYGGYFAVTTSGENGVGSPVGNGNSYFDWPAQGYNFVPGTVVCGSGIWDLSYGVVGNPVPEPIGIVIVGLALLLIATARLPASA